MIEGLVWGMSPPMPPCQTSQSLIIYHDRLWLFVWRLSKLLQHPRPLCRLQQHSHHRHLRHGKQPLIPSSPFPHQPPPPYSTHSNNPPRE
jgi:hypothetical protein